MAAVALLLVSYNGSSATPSEATMASIGTTTSKVGVDFFAQLQINAEDDLFGLPNFSTDDVTITASGGDFIGFNPLGGPFNADGCYDNFLTPCEDIGYTTVDSNGFGDNGLNGDNCDSLWSTGDTNIAIATDGDGCGATPNLNTTHLEQWWQAPPGFDGGNVTFCAEQDTDVLCTNIVVVGSVSKLNVYAIRDSEGDGSNETTRCKDTPVYVIAAAEYSFNNVTTFDNNRAILCVEAFDSNGTQVPGADIIWTTTKGALAFAVTNTGTLIPPGFAGPNVDNALNRLTSGGTTASSDVPATVTVQNGSATATTQVWFGGDPASCSIADFSKDLDIGDAAEVKATILDASKNPVPDGIVAHFVEVDSGDGADNVEFVSVLEDTVKGVVSAKIIAAIAGVTTVSVVTEQIGPGPGDATCAEALDLSGDIHVTPLACEDDPDFILAGSKPPAAGGWGTFLFCGGTNAQLLTATGCTTTSTTVIFYNKPNGGWVAWVVGSQVAAANAEWLAMFPNEHVSIPNPTIFTANCKAPTA